MGHPVPLHRALQVFGGEDADAGGGDPGWPGGGGGAGARGPMNLREAACHARSPRSAAFCWDPDGSPRSPDGLSFRQPQKDHMSHGCTSRLICPSDPAQPHGSARATLWLEGGSLGTTGGHGERPGTRTREPRGAERRRGQEGERSPLLCVCVFGRLKDSQYQRLTVCTCRPSSLGQFLSQMPDCSPTDTGLLSAPGSASTQDHRPGR